MFKVALLGATNTGKTTFLRKLMGKDIPIEYTTTTFNVSVPYKDTLSGQEIMITDTSPSTKEEIWLSDYDGYIVFFDMARPRTYEMANGIIATIKKHGDFGVKIVLVGTKPSELFTETIPHIPCVVFDPSLSVLAFPWSVFNVGEKKNRQVLNSIQSMRDHHKREYEKAKREMEYHRDAVQRFETQLIRFDDMGVI